MRMIVGIYIRLPPEELARLRERPEILPKYDPRVALEDGRGLDIGRAWDTLGVFLDGGFHLPETGPIVGDHPMPPTDDRATWSYVEPDEVKTFAAELATIDKAEFYRRYQVDAEESVEIPDSRTGGWGDQGAYLFKKLRILAGHYRRAAEHGEGMLVRIGERI